jgi:hypothetical protein
MFGFTRKLRFLVSSGDVCLYVFLEVVLVTALSVLLIFATPSAFAYHWLCGIATVAIALASLALSWLNTRTFLRQVLDAMMAGTTNRTPEQNALLRAYVGIWGKFTTESFTLMGLWWGNAEHKAFARDFWIVSNSLDCVRQLG